LQNCQRQKLFQNIYFPRNLKNNQQLFCALTQPSPFTCLTIYLLTYLPTYLWLGSR
jgi:hypothetical protein